MELSKVQIEEVIDNHVVNKENGFNDIMQFTLNALMKAERTIALSEQPKGTNKANGYRPGRAYGNGKILELAIPRDRNGHFYPKILALLRDQQAETDQMVSALYAQGLTQSQIGDVFEQLYGRHYSASTIGRMIEWMREDVKQWRERPLERRYPVIFIDCIYVKVRRETVQNEAFYVVLAVNEEGCREVIAVNSLPTESATGWQDLFEQLQKRGLEEVGLVVADGLAGLEPAVSRVWPRTPLQWCVTHIKRQTMSKVRPADKEELAKDLRDVFKTGGEEDSSEKGWARWQKFCSKWKHKYQSFRKMESNPHYRTGFTYLDFDPRVHAMIYTTNWIERLNRDFRRVLKMRSSMPGEDSVITLIGKVSMDKRAYQRKLPAIMHDRKLFPKPDPASETDKNKT